MNDSSNQIRTAKKRALITGASAGIGYELAKCFAQNGYDLILIARNQEKLNAIAADFKSHYGTEVYVISADLSVPRAAEVVMKLTNERSIDVLVNNAGYAAYGPFIENDIDTILGSIRLNIEALTHLTRLIVPIMVRQGSGKILNVSSTAAFQPGPLMAVYYSTKAYVLSFSEALRFELKGKGIVVTTLCPGATKTEFQDKARFNKSNLIKLGMMKADVVAKAGFYGLMKGKAIVVPGLKNKFGAFIIRFSPRSIVLKTVYKLNKTE